MGGIRAAAVPAGRHRRLLAGLVALVGLGLLVVRILDEETMLGEELPGYREYTARVRYRLIPLVW